MQRIYLIITAIAISVLMAASPCYGQFNTGFINTSPPGANTADQQNNNLEADSMIEMPDGRWYAFKIEPGALMMCMWYR